MLKNNKSNNNNIDYIISYYYELVEVFQNFISDERLTQKGLGTF